MFKFPALPAFAVLTVAACKVSGNSLSSGSFVIPGLSLTGETFTPSVIPGLCAMGCTL